MTNILSNSPVYTDFTVGVNTYGPNSGFADQPGAPGSVATNDVSTTSVDYLNGSLVTAMIASTPADGFTTTKVEWYQVNVSSGTPVLSLQGVVDPGPGVATFFPTVAMNPSTGDLGLTWMQSSLSEYVSMYVAGLALPSHGNLGVADAPGPDPRPRASGTATTARSSTIPARTLLGRQRVRRRPTPARSGTPGSLSSHPPPRSVPTITRSTPTPATICTSPPRRRPAARTSSSTTSTPSCCSTTRTAIWWPSPPATRPTAATR